MMKDFVSVRISETVGDFQHQLMRLMREHKRAYVANLGLDFRHENEIFANERRMAMISYRLDDANFHQFAALLDHHEYDAAAQWIKEDAE